MQSRMLLNLFLPPFLVFIGGVCAWVFLAFLVPSITVDSHMLSGISEASSKYAPLVFWMASLAASIWSLVQIYTYWQWEKGDIVGCSNCGGIVTQKFGRYGPYVRCLACGSKEKN